MQKNNPATEVENIELLINNPPTLASAQKHNQSVTKEYTAGTVGMNMLSEEEQSMVTQLANSIDVTNVEQVVNYGVEAQRNISDFSVSVLTKVRTMDLGEIGTSLKELTIALDATIEPERKGIRGLFQKAKRSAGTVRATIAKAETNVDRIEQDLLGHEAVLLQDIAMLQQMYELNLQYYKALTMYIIAGKMALDAATADRLTELKAIAEQTGKQEDVQAYSDYNDLCHRFEKKLADLEITRVITVQSAPQIRMLQNNDRELLDQLQSSIANTIPLWRNQLVISLGVEHTRRALDAQTALSDKTNELLTKNSEALKLATVETAKATERPIVDIETLRQCNEDLITSITEVIKIHEQGSVKRAKAREELVRIESELKKAMLEASR